MMDRKNDNQPGQPLDVRVAVQEFAGTWKIPKLYGLYRQCGLLAASFDDDMASDWSQCPPSPTDIEGRCRGLLKEYPAVARVLAVGEMASEIAGQCLGGKVRARELRQVTGRYLFPIMDTVESLAAAWSSPELVQAGESNTYGVAKAEIWLAGIVENGGFWTDSEALVYFLSRGHLEGEFLEPIAALRERWKSSSESQGREVGDADLAMEDALDDASTGLDTSPVREPAVPSPRFWYEVGYSVDATMLRTAESVGIDGYDRLCGPLNRYVCWDAAQHRTQSVYPALHLFALCRAELALETMSMGISSLASNIMRGKRDKAKPWAVYLRHPDGAGGNEQVLARDLSKIPRAPEKSERVESVAIASAMVFFRYRAPHAGVDDQVVRAAGRFLMGKQQPSGAWPAIGCYLQDVDSILATAMAVHALWAGKPNRWKMAIIKAAAWLRTKQDGFGRWAENGSDAVFLTVLVLDAMELAEGRTVVTFKASNVRPRLRSRLVQGGIASPASLPAGVVDRLRGVPAKDEAHREMKGIVWVLRNQSSMEIAEKVRKQTGITVTPSRIRQVRLEMIAWMKVDTPHSPSPDDQRVFLDVLRELRLHWRRVFSAREWDEMVGDLENNEPSDLANVVTEAIWQYQGDRDAAVQAGRTFLRTRQRERDVEWPAGDLGDVGADVDEDTGGRLT